MLILALVSVQTVNGQDAITKSEFLGRESYSIQNSNMRITMLTGGGYIAELRLISADGKESVNPLFVPHYKTIDPHELYPRKSSGFVWYR